MERGECMSRGKHLSLEEARKKKGGLKRFADEHPSVGDADKFNALLNAMAGQRHSSGSGTSGETGAASCGGTRSPKGTSEDAS